MCAAKRLANYHAVSHSPLTPCACSALPVIYLCLCLLSHASLFPFCLYANVNPVVNVRSKNTAREVEEELDVSDTRTGGDMAPKC